jgi:hypothetical protein
MTEWWTYRPSDFLMFAPRTYWRLFELANADAWPLAALLALLLLAALRSGRRAATAVLALAWAYVGWAFVLQRYAPINWAAEYAGWVFIAEAAALAAWAARPAVEGAGHIGRRVGCGLVGWALVVQPLLAPLQGRPWRQAELFGIAPDPTVIATLGVLLLNPPRGAARALWFAPGLAAAASAATLGTMGSPQGWVPAAALALALFASFRPGLRAGRAGCLPGR